MEEILHTPMIPSWSQTKPSDSVAVSYGRSSVDAVAAAAADGGFRFTACEEIMEIQRRRRRWLQY